MTTIRYVQIPDTDAGHRRAADLICDAARLGPRYADAGEGPRHPVTLGYFEQKKELRPVKKRDGRIVDEWCSVKDEYLHTVRTMEFFDVNEAGGTYFTGLDRCPRDPANWLEWGKPSIRNVRADRITDITVHRLAPYRLQNEYFLKRVRDHAAAQRWAKVSTLTDDALWKMIEHASNPTDAITRVARTLAAV